MPISPIGPRNPEAGFTLLEIMVTVFVLGLLVTLGTKTWSMQSTRTLARASHQISHYLTLVKERAHTRHQLHRVYWDLDRQEARCVVVTPQGEERILTDPLIPQVWRWPQTVRLRDVWTAETGQTQEGQRITTVNPLGQVQPTALHFQLATHTLPLPIITLLVRSTSGTPEVIHGDVVYPPQP